MTFASPQILWGLFLLLIPIIVHLFLFRRTKKIYFSNVSRIALVKDDTKSRNRLQHLLVLLMRLLFVFFLILAFLGPRKSTEGTEASRSVIFIDNSYSLSREVDGGVSGLTEMLATVSQYVSNRSLDHEFVILTNDFDPFSNHFKSRGETLDYLTEIEFSSIARNAEAVVNRLSNYVGEDVAFLIFSDFQKTTFDLEAVNFSAFASNSISLFPLRSDNLSNIYVDSVYLSSPFFNLDQLNGIVFVVGNVGADQPKEASFRLLEGTKLIGSQTVSVAANARTEVSFEVDLKRIKTGKLSLTFEDYPVSFDNDFLLSLPRFQRVKIGVVSSEDRSYFESVFGNEAFFEVTRFEVNRIDFSILQAMDLVVVEGLNALPEWVRTMEGVDFVVVPSGQQYDVDELAEYLNMDVSVSEVGEAPENLRLQNTDHPFFEGLLGDIPQNLAMPRAKTALRHRSTVNTILGNEFGEPFLSIFSRDKNLYLFCGPVSKVYTDLADHAVFLPLMYRIAQRSADVVDLVSYRFDQRLVELVSENTGNKPIALQGSSTRLVPNHYFSGGKLLIELPSSGLNEGFYAVMEGADTLMFLALNVPKSESLMETHTGSELTERFASEGNVRVIAETTAFERSAGVGLNGGAEYWKYALALSLLFAFVEILLVRLARVNHKG